MTHGEVQETDTCPEFVRGVYQNVVHWYNSAESKAQLILTLDGVFLAFVASGLVQSTELIRNPHWLTASLLGLMVLCLGISISFGIACVWSRIYSPEHLRDLIQKEGVDISDYKTYKPTVCWFFQMINELKKDEFSKRMKEISPVFEIEALASQVFILSGNVRKKHRYVNYSFVFAGATLLFFALSAASIVLHQQQLL